MPSSFYLQILLNGLQLASVYILTALGFTLIFGILNIVNIAHTNFYMLGGYVIWLLFGVWKVNYFPALLIAIAVVGLIGLGIERIIFRRLQGLVMPTIIASIGLMQVLEQSALIGFGTTEKIVPVPFPGMLQFWGTVFPVQRLMVMLIAIVLMVALVWWVQNTKPGLALRAVAIDKETCSVYGISPVRYGSLCFAIGCGLAGAAGALVAPIFYVNPFMGDAPLLKIFIIIIIGGLGSVPGTILGGLLLGLIDSFVATLFDSVIAAMVGFGMVIIVLIVKPTGFLGHE
jgi:branched-chain amino acid transport system permease protein